MNRIQPTARTAAIPSRRAAPLDGAGRPRKDELPEPEPAADLATARCPARWLAVAFAVPLAVYLALLPRFLLYSSPPTGDQPYYLLMTASLVQDGDLNLRNNYEQRDYGKFYERAPHPPGFVGMEAPDPLLVVRARTVRSPSEWYDHRSAGLPALLVPSWVVGSWLGLWWPATIVFMCVVGALVALNVFLLAYELTGRLWAALAVWASVAFSNPVMSFSYLIFTELTTALVVVYAFRRLAVGWRKNGCLQLALVGASVGAVPWLAWRALPIALALLAYAAVQWRRGRRATSGKTRAFEGGHLSSAAFLLVPVAVEFGLLGWYNTFLFGSPLVGGSQRAVYQPPLAWPWSGIDELRSFVRHVFGLTFDRQMGLLTHTPVLVFAAVGVVAMLRCGRAADRRLLVAAALLALPYMTVVASFGAWNGVWNPPARYETALVPLAAAPIAFALVAWRDWLVKALYAVLALPGLAIQAIRMDDARLMWPANSVFARVADSFVQLDVRGWLPAFSPLEKATFARDTAFLTATAIAVIVFCFLLPEPLWARGGPGAQARRYALAATVVVLVGAAWFFMIQHVQEGAAS